MYVAHDIDTYRPVQVSKLCVALLEGRLASLLAVPRLREASLQHLSRLRRRATSNRTADAQSNKQTHARHTHARHMHVRNVSRCHAYACPHVTSCMPLSDWKELSQEEEKERTEGGRRKED
jgi:hypothetical protein